MIGLFRRRDRATRSRSHGSSRAHIGRIGIERLEPRWLLAAQPTVMLSVPPRPLLGESMTFAVSFANASPTDAGYGPFVDLLMPATGANGNDGITFQSATFMGTTLSPIVLTIGPTGQVAHPLARTSTGAPVMISGTPGDQLVVLPLPFGSYTPGQPAADLQVQALVSPLANVDYTLSIQASGGFSLGNDPIDDPAADPSIIGPGQTAPATPALLKLTKQYLGPESETATGPSFPERYLISVQVAQGQTVTNLDITDLLPSNLQFVQVVQTAIHGVPTAATPISTPSTSTPGGTLTRQFASVTGDGSASDASLLFEFYIPQADSVGTPVLPPGVGAPSTSLDQASSQADWTPLDPRDPAGTFTSNTDTHTLADRAVAVQKTVTNVNHTGPANANSPGDTLQYTIQFQVSDFFALQNLVVSDLISDGQRIDPGFTPMLLVDGHGFSLANAPFSAANYTVAGNYTGAVPPPSAPDGTTNVLFRVSDEMITRGQSGQLLGGMVSPAGGYLPFPGVGPTTGTITFQTVIQKTFSNVPAPGAVVGQGDRLADDLTTTAGVLDNTTFASTGHTVTDDSHATAVISAGTLQKTIYALNGNPSLSFPLSITPGDTVTYRLQYSMPNSNLSDLILRDYLPLPIFAASTVTTFQPVVNASAPATGTAKFGPGDTFYSLSGLVPQLTTNAVSNSVTFDWPQYVNAGNITSTVDVLFTVTVSAQPFADQLLLTNLAQSTETTSNNEPVTGGQIAQVTLTEPKLAITKGVVATNDPGAGFTAPVGPVGFTAPGSAGYRGQGVINSSGLAATPIDANLNGCQAGDLVTFAVVVQNAGTGRNGAYNIMFQDTLPAGFVIPAGGLNLTVTDGAGASFSVIDLGGGLFGSGLELVDPGPTVTPPGALDPYDPSSGRNIAVLTYDLQVAANVSPSQTIVNTASLFNYASAPGGPNFLPASLDDPASVTCRNVGVSKSITATDQPFTTGTNLAIGEVATYGVVITIPQGVALNAKLVDTLPNGLAIVDLQSLTTSDPLLVTASAGSFATILGAATVGAGGSSVTFTFGDITNTDTNPAHTETITAVYRVVAINVAANTNNRAQSNSAKCSYTGGSATGQTTAQIVVPRMQVAKTIDNPRAEAGDIVTYTITISHAGGSGADAFDVNLSDVVPAGVTYVPGSFASVSGLAPTSLGASGAVLSASYAAFPRGSTSVLGFKAVVDDNIGAYQNVTNTANIAYTTLPGPTASPISPYNSSSYERTGNPLDPGGAANNLNAQASASLTPTPALSKVITGTDQSFTIGNEVAIGEQIHYQVAIAVPQGVSPGSTLTDQLPAGLALVSVDTISATSHVSTSVPGGFAAVLAGATVGSGGSSVFLDFGTLTNSARDHSAQSVTVNYTVVVLNVNANQTGTALQNLATYQTGPGTATASAPKVDVVVPELDLAKTIDPSTGDAGGAPLTVQLAVSHNIASATDAFDVVVSDPLPGALDYVPGSVHVVSGLAPSTINVVGRNVVATYAQFPLGASSVLAFQAMLNATAAPGQTLLNTANTTYTTLPGPVSGPLSPYNPVSTERTGNPNQPGGDVNNLAAADNAPITLNASTLQGTVYVDMNNNGVLEPGEARLPGVTITLGGHDNLGNPISLTTTTDASGDYLFSGLRPGVYTLTETQPAGYLSGKNTVGSQGGTAAFPPASVLGNLVLPVGASTIGTGNNFAELLPSSLAGTVFLDHNDDGIQDPGDPGIPGVTVTLTGADDIAQSIHIVATTDASGHYLFAGLRPGNYTLHETQPAGYYSGKNSIGTQGGAVAPDDFLTDIVLQPGVDGVGNNFAERIAGSLSGSVYWDVNHDGVMNSADFGIVNVRITLGGIDDLGLPVHATTFTNATGAYQFLDLRPGTYTLTETQPPRFRSYVNNVGTLGGHVIGDHFFSIVVGSGDHGVQYNYGELQDPKCRLRSLAMQVGDRVSRDQAARAANPTAFDRAHPRVGPLLAAGIVPRGVGGYPLGPLAYKLVPTLGTKRLFWQTVPGTGKRVLVGVPIFPGLPMTPAALRARAVSHRG